MTINTENNIRNQVRKILLKEVVLTELTNKFKNEVEIIYRDKNLVCLIPKSQMASYIYGQKAKWCQKDKCGFDAWSNQGLLIRFLFKTGRKIRFTYFTTGFKKNSYSWSNEQGFHILEGKGNPFEAFSNRENKSDMEQDVLNLIHNEIPKECKLKVLEFIKKNEFYYDYKYRDEEYKPVSLQLKQEEFNKIYNHYNDVFYAIRSKNKNALISIYFDRQTKEFVINHAENYGINNNYLTQNEHFKDSKSFEKRIIELINQYRK